MTDEIGLAVGIIIAAGIAYLCRRKGPSRAEDAALLLFPVLLVLWRSCLFPLTAALQPFGPEFYLLAPYVDLTREQFLILWVYAALLVVALGVAQIASRRVFLASGLVVAVTLSSLDNRNIPARRRWNYAGSMGYPSREDLVVIDKVVKLFLEYRRAHPRLSFEETPKILIPNSLHLVGTEQWLFPHGGTRILPFYDVFPVAFYYNRGCADYSYASYREHVCDRLDLDWLSRHGIRYLFLPTDLGAICIADIDALLARSRLLFRGHRAVFAELPAPDGSKP